MTLFVTFLFMAIFIIIVLGVRRGREVEARTFTNDELLKDRKIALTKRSGQRNSIALIVIAIAGLSSAKFLPLSYVAVKGFYLAARESMNFAPDRSPHVEREAVEPAVSTAHKTSPEDFVIPKTAWSEKRSLIDLRIFDEVKVAAKNEGFEPNGLASSLVNTKIPKELFLGSDDQNEFSIRRTDMQQKTKVNDLSKLGDDARVGVNSVFGSMSYEDYKAAERDLERSK